MSQAADPTALALEQNAVIAASAGTGKTHLLTNLYLALVLGLGPDAKPVAAERIAATTFSRAAAREIRERLEQRLAVLAGEARVEGVIGKDAALARLAETRGLSDRELSGRAARALEDLPRAFIDTLHGLATRLVRTHALELELSPGFTILDESAAFEDAETALDEVLSQALDEGGDSAKAALALIDSCHGLEGTRSALLGLFGLLDEEGLGSGELAPPSHLAEGAELATTMRDTARAVLGHGRSHPLAAAADEVLAALTEPIDAPRLERGLVALLGERRPKLEKYPAGPELLSLLDSVPAAATSKNRADQLALAARFVARAPELAVESRGIAELVGRIQQSRRRRRVEKSQLGFGDVLWLAREVLLTRPELQAEAAENLDALLVDEFQDTSRVQRDLLLLLRQSPEAARQRAPGVLPEASSLQPRGLVVVGDRKQSIYAFRGADVSVYARLAAELAGEPAARALDLRGVRASENPIARFSTLSENYRSAPGILNFVNAVARRDFTEAPRRAFEIRYTEPEALIPGRRDAAPGRVTLIDAEPVPRAEDPLLSRAEGPLLAAFTIAGFCARSHAEGTPLANIAVLSRRRAMLPLLEVALDRFQIPFVVAGRALYATPEVRDLAALLRVALDPHDRHALVVVARSPLGGISDPGLVELSEPGRGLLPARRWDPDSVSDARDRALVVELKQRLVELADVGPRLSPRDALSFAVERFELECVLGAQPRGPGRFGNVGRLLEIAARHGGNLPRFSRWLERQISLEVDESEAAVFSEGDDAVRLLTVHGSKGLAFEVTVLADADAHEVPHSAPLSLLRNDDGSIELVVRHRGPDGAEYTRLMGRAAVDARDRALAERQRLSYVALTRARRELVIVLPQKPRPNTLALSIQDVLASGVLDGEAALVRVQGAELLEAPPRPNAAPAPPLPVPRRPEEPSFRAAAVGVTALADFSICPRRFQLLHVLGIDEPTFSDARGDGADDARALGSAAHRVLERFPLERFGTTIAVEELTRALEREGLDPELEATRRTAAGIAAFLGGRYAASLVEPGTRVHRELELTELVDASDRERPQLELFARAVERKALIKATLDLVVERSDGSLDVVDYKRTRGGDDRRYALQLAAYASVCRARFAATTLRVGLVHLLADEPEPDWFAPESAELGALVSDLVRRRYSGEFPPVPATRCKAARCGFLAACHPNAERERSRNPVEN